MASATSILKTHLTRKYFATISATVLIFSIWGFSDNLFWDIGQPSNSDPKFVVHGLFCLAWMVIFFLQSMLVANRNVALHRKLGIAGIIIAIGTLVSTVYLFAAIWKGWENMAPFVKANRVLFSSFAICVFWAFYIRGKSAWHKRLMLVGTLFMMEPILSRVFGTAEITILKGMSDSQLDFYWYIVVFTLWGLLFMSLFAHDWLTSKRFHPVTVGGAAWIVTAWTTVHFV